MLGAMGSEKVELLERIYERWGRGDFKTDEAYEENFTITMGVGFPDTGVHAGRDGVAAYMRSFLEPWEWITIKAEQIEAEGDRVLVRVLQSGTGSASGIAVEFRYFQLWSFAGDRPVEMETIREEDEARIALSR
jgi:ketosteroid isomerase-like protein